MITKLSLGLALIVALAAGAVSMSSSPTDSTAKTGCCSAKVATCSAKADCCAKAGCCDGCPDCNCDKACCDDCSNGCECKCDSESLGKISGLSIE